MGSSLLVEPDTERESSGTQASITASQRANNGAAARRSKEGEHVVAYHGVADPTSQAGRCPDPRSPVGCLLGFFPDPRLQGRSPGRGGRVRQQILRGQYPTDGAEPVRSVQGPP